MGLIFAFFGFALILASLPVVYGVCKLVDQNDSVNAWNFLGEGSTKIMFVALSLLLILPYGFLLLPVVLALSCISPAGRLDWNQHRKNRLLTVMVVLMMLMLSGFLPVEQPRAPAEWGEPLATENPYAGYWPNGEQYTWVFAETLNPTNFEVVQSMVLRTPHQYGPFQQVESSIWISSFLGMQESRMRQAIDLVDERVQSIRIDSSSFNLEMKENAQEHIFRSTSKDVELKVWVFDCYTTSGINPDGTKIGEVVLVGQARWGGAVDLLVVLRPFFHDGLTSDPYAESIVNQWVV